MTHEEKKEKIKSLVVEILQNSIQYMEKKIEPILNSGSVDVSKWDEKINPMILPKTIVIALLENEAKQYTGRGTSFEKDVKKLVKNIKYFL